MESGSSRNVCITNFLTLMERKTDYSLSEIYRGRKRMIMCVIKDIE